MRFFSLGRPAIRVVFSVMTACAALAACLSLPANQAHAQGPSGPTLTTLHPFSALSTSSPATNSDGAAPNAALVMGSDGILYGTTTNGGTSGMGTVFKITTAGALTTLVSFTGPAGAVLGANPYDRLVQGSDGDSYGTTDGGGVSGLGTVFKVTPTGSLITLHSFNGIDGQAPYGGLTLGDDGNFYGLTRFGSASGNGTFFKVTPSGVFTSLGNAFSSSAALVKSGDGNFYGTTGGSAYNYGGTVFQITPAGAATTLAMFSGLNGADGDLSASLVQGSDGDFYGTTSNGGSGWDPVNFQLGDGTVFKVTPAGTLTSLYSFSAPGAGGKNGDGVSPEAGLVEGPDGNFYGTTAFGGTSGLGTAFSITPSGTLTTLIDFDGANGANPDADLISDGHGGFYGTTVSGGANGTGTVFKLTIPGIASAATLTGISPAAVQAGSLPFTLTVTGTGFAHGVTANFNGTALTPMTASSTKLTVTVPATLVATQSRFSVTVSNPGAAPSNALPFTVTPGLTLTGVSPASAPAGSGPVSITVTGGNFVNGCVVKWNAQPLPTFYLSPTEATATVPASYLATAGTAKITISNPHVHATAPLTFMVTAH